jgi:basic amino acid/polyamine antiporter, APA family
VNEPLTAPPARPALVRAIGRWDLTAAVINGVIGSSIFGMPATLAALTGALSPLAFVIAGLGVLTIVLCFAEVSSRFDEPGGPYVYAHAAFGPAVGFQAGWLTFWIRVTSVAANLNIFVNYLGQVLPAVQDPAGRALVMVAVMAVITTINLRGVRQATWTVDAFTIAKLVPLVLLVLLGLSKISAETIATQTVAQPDWTSAVLLLVFAYGGFEAPLITATEARNPRRDSAFALLMGLMVIGLVYVLVQVVVAGIVPNLAREKAPVAAAFSVLLGPAGVLLASVAAMVSIYGWATGSVLQSPRLLYSMAERRELPAIFARVHPRFHTPDVAILTYASLSLALALYGSFQWNATLSAIVRLVTYGLTCVALFVFRRREGQGGRGAAPEPPKAHTPAFHLRGAYVIGPLAVVFCLWLLSTRTFAQAWVLAAIMLVGVLLWAATRRHASARAPLQ